MSMQYKPDQFVSALSTLRKLSEDLSAGLHGGEAPHAAAVKAIVDVTEVLIADLSGESSAIPRDDMIAGVCRRLAAAVTSWADDPACARRAAAFHLARTALSVAGEDEPSEPFEAGAIEYLASKAEEPTEEEFMSMVYTVATTDPGLLFELTRRLMWTASEWEDDHLRSVAMYLGCAAANPGSDMETEIHDAVAVGLLNSILSEELLVTLSSRLAELRENKLKLN